MLSRWLAVTSLGCDDLTGLGLVHALTRDQDRILDSIVNVFNVVDRHSCAVLDALRTTDAHRAPRSRIVSVHTVTGYKTAFWVTLEPALTAGYDFVWLRDSDVLADAHVFSLPEVEHWMRHTGASVAQPSVLPLDGRSKSHGWWTPFRAAFHASCLVSTTPIIEQMTPIFTRGAFDTLRRHLATVPPGLLTTDSGDFGLETFWCGLFARGRPGNDARPSSTLVRAGTAGEAQAASCILLHHVSVVHTDTRTMRRFTPPRTTAADMNPWSNGTFARGLRNHLIDNWPEVMNASGAPGDVHHKQHRNRCWGVLAPSAQPSTLHRANTTAAVTSTPPRAARAATPRAPTRERRANIATPHQSAMNRSSDQADTDALASGGARQTRHAPRHQTAKRPVS